MVGVMVLGHGKVAEGLKDSAEMIVGSQDGLDSLAFCEGADLTEYKQQIAARALRLDQGKGVLFLVDLLGGTPCNMALLLSTETNCKVVAGVNIPMLLTVLLSREGLTLDELAELAQNAGVEGVQKVQVADEEEPN